jgi:hypothetical protein
LELGAAALAVLALGAAALAVLALAALDVDVAVAALDVDVAALVSVLGKDCSRRNGS